MTAPIGNTESAAPIVSTTAGMHTLSGKVPEFSTAGSSIRIGHSIGRAATAPPPPPKSPSPADTDAKNSSHDMSSSPVGLALGVHTFTPGTTSPGGPANASTREGRAWLEQSAPAPSSGAGAPPATRPPLVCKADWLVPGWQERGSGTKGVDSTRLVGPDAAWRPSPYALGPLDPAWRCLNLQFSTLQANAPPRSW